MFRKKNISVILGSAFGILLVVLVIIGAVSFAGNVYNKKLSKEASLRSKVSVQVSSLIRLQIKQVAVARSYFITSVEGELKRYNETRNDYSKAFNELRSKLNDPEEQKLVGDIITAYDLWDKETQRLIELKKAGREPELIERQKTGVAPKLSAEVGNALTKLANYETQQVDKAFAQQESYADLQQWSTILLTLLAVLLAIGGSIMSTRVIGDRISKAQHAIQSVANKDLTQEDIVVETTDTLGQAAEAVNEMKHSLTDVIGNLSLIASQVAGASTELAATAEGAHQGAERQRTETEQVASRIEQMTDAIGLMAEHASKISQAASIAASGAQEGDTSMSNTVHLIERIAEQVGKVGSVVEELEGNSRSIGQIVNVIEEIAEQTNLLALNAAIEAARAGEQGRGFAVVAGEVRRLAERTGSATSEIGAIIKTVQQNTEKAVTEMQIGKSQVSEGVYQTEQTRDLLRQILNSVSEVDSMMQQIAASTTQQSAATQEASQSLNSIVGLVHEASVGAQHSQEAARELSKLSSNMHTLIEEFRLPATEEPVRFSLPQMQPQRVLSAKKQAQPFAKQRS